MYDFHIHSNHSTHSKESMIDIVHTAIHKNFKCVCFTEFINGKSFANEKKLFQSKLDYFDDIKKVKYKFNKFINILSGVEVELDISLLPLYHRFINNNPFDFVILSFKDTNFNINSKDKNTTIQIIKDYYNNIYETLLLFNNFDVIGHLDYIDKHIIDNGFNINFEDYQDYIDNILNLLIKNNKGLEINTSGFRLGLNTFFPKAEILQRYKELGGSIITIGSDSNNMDQLGAYYMETKKIIHDLGFDTIYIYETREAVPIEF